MNGVLASYLAAERARDARALAVHAMAALSVPLVVQTVWPALVEADAVYLLRAGWGFAVLAAAVAFAVEWRHRIAAGLGAAALRRPGR